MHPGDLFENRFRIEREVGRGSFGVVYLAIDNHTGGPVAIKILLPWTRTLPELEHRLQREAKLTRMLKSNHAVKIQDVLKAADGSVYVIMEFLNGRELTELVRQHSKLPIARVTDIALQTLDAVGEAHALGVVHRDLKPHNIFICDGTAGDDVKVLDFGIAKVVGKEDGSGLSETTRLTASGGVLGTPEYMSPEQCQGEVVTMASDFYSLGVVLYEALTGRVPFDDPSQVRVMMMHNTDSPPPLPSSIAGTPLGRAVMRALEKNPAARFASAAEFAAAISGQRVPEAAYAAPVSQSTGTPAGARGTRNSAIEAPPDSLPKLISSRGTAIVGSPPAPVAKKSTRLIFREPEAQQPSPSSSAQPSSAGSVKIVVAAVVGVILLMGVWLALRFLL